jgi:hypothetical protein
VTGHPIPTRIVARRPGDPAVLVAAAPKFDGNWLGTAAILTCRPSWKQPGNGISATRTAMPSRQLAGLRPPAFGFSESVRGQN